MKSYQLTFEERRDAEIDKIQELYKFPITFIELYDITLSAEKTGLCFHDGVSIIVINLIDYKINETKYTWEFRKGSNTIEIDKQTRRIQTYLL